MADPIAKIPTPNTFKGGLLAGFPMTSLGRAEVQKPTWEFIGGKATGGAAGILAGGTVSMLGYGLIDASSSSDLMSGARSVVNGVEEATGHGITKKIAKPVGVVMATVGAGYALVSVLPLIACFYDAQEKLKG